jgi:hypothetical protein
MGGWPSTTGNPSGGGRWNNDDDGYDDDEGCDEGSTPSFSVRSYFNDRSRRDDMHYRNRCNFDLEGLRDETREERNNLFQKKSSLETHVAKLGSLLGEEYWGHCHWQDYDEYAQKYFGTESLSDFANSTLELLVESHKRVADFKHEHQKMMNHWSWVSKLPKISERQHILISHGLTRAPFGSHIVNGRITNQPQYVWKKNLDDKAESYKIVGANPASSSGDYAVSDEQIERLAQLGDEFMVLYSDMKQKEISVIQCYHIFKPARRGNSTQHWMEWRDTSFGQLRSDFRNMLSNLRYPTSEFHPYQLSDHENLYEKIYNNIKKDYDEAWLELEECTAEYNAFDTECDTRRQKIRASYGF